MILQSLSKSKINQNYRVELRVVGFMACGEKLEFKENNVELLIYHDGKTGIENPYKYSAE